MNEYAKVVYEAIWIVLSLIEEHDRTAVFLALHAECEMALSRRGYERTDEGWVEKEQARHG